MQTLSRDNSNYPGGDCSFTTCPILLLCALPVLEAQAWEPGKEKEVTLSCPTPFNLQSHLQWWGKRALRLKFKSKLQPQSSWRVQVGLLLPLTRTGPVGSAPTPSSHCPVGGVTDSMAGSTQQGCKSEVESYKGSVNTES